jgi:ribosomal protein S18 acetylase RimI-like enzyme
LPLAPAAQGRGLGTAILRRLAREAEGRGRALGLSVDRINVRALRLYERLGFLRTGATETELHLRHGVGA